MTTWWNDTHELLSYAFVHHALIAAAVLGIISGLVAPLVVMRKMSFAVHSSSELALMGASAALLVGASVSWGAILGSVAAAVVFALLGRRQTDATVGVVLTFGMGLSVLFIYLYPGKASNAFSLLTGQIVGVTSQALTTLLITAVIVVAVVAILWRPLLFSSSDSTVAAGMGVRVGVISVIFSATVGLVAAQGVQIVGALLVVALLITPGAAAVQISSSPVRTIVLSTLFAEAAAVGGVILSLAPGLPISVFVTSISFTIYLICWTAGAVRRRTAHRTLATV